MIMTSKQSMIKNVCFRFEAAITIFGGHSATLRTGYRPVVHIGGIRQTVKMILPIDDDSNDGDGKLPECVQKNHGNSKTQKIKSGDVTRVTFKFVTRPEYIDLGMIFVFRSGLLHGVGCIIGTTSLDRDDDAQPEPIRKTRKNQYIAKKTRMIR